MFRICSKAGIDREGFVYMIRISSAYKLILCFSFLTLIPVISGNFLINSARDSIERTNMRRDRGHPCLIPLVMEIFLEKKPDVKTYADREVYNQLT